MYEYSTFDVVTLNESLMYIVTPNYTKQVPNQLVPELLLELDTARRMNSPFHALMAKFAQPVWQERTVLVHSRSHAFKIQIV